MRAIPVTALSNDALSGAFRSLFINTDDVVPSGETDGTILKEKR